jgi:hypothetical protein
VKPDWNKVFLSRADRRDLLQDFSVHGEYIGGTGEVVLPKWCTTGADEIAVPLREWTFACPLVSHPTVAQKNGRADNLHQPCRLDFSWNYCPF